MQIPIGIDEYQMMREDLLTIVKNIRHNPRFGTEGIGKCDFLEMRSALNITVSEGPVQKGRATVTVGLLAADELENRMIEARRWRRMNGGVLENPVFFIPLQYSIYQYTRELYLLIHEVFLGQPFFRKANIYTVSEKKQYCIEMVPLLHKDFAEETKDCHIIPH